MAITKSVSSTKRSKNQEAAAGPAAEAVGADAVPLRKPEEAEAETRKAVKDQEPRGKKPKLIRDSFTLPEADYALIKALKERCLAAGLEVKKSEVLRVALIVLAKQNDAKLLTAVKALPRIKTGRPKK